MNNLAFNFVPFMCTVWKHHAVATLESVLKHCLVQNAHPNN